MRKLALLFFAVLVTAVISVPAVYAGDDLAQKFDKVLTEAKETNGFQIKAADVYKMITDKRQDFLIVDVRPVPPGQAGGKIAGSIFIPYYDIIGRGMIGFHPEKDRLISIPQV